MICYNSVKKNNGDGSIPCDGGLTPLCSGRITGGYTAPDLTGLPPKSLATLTTSHTRQPLDLIISSPIVGATSR